MKHNYIAENIRIYRERANLTQQQLADKIGVSWEMISRYERSQNSPLKRLDNLSSALRVSKSQLLEKHIPQKYNNSEYKIPLFMHVPFSNRLDANHTNYFYICPEWIFRRDTQSIAIDTSLIVSDTSELKKSGILYISTQLQPQRDDLILVRDSGELILKKYNKKIYSNILGKVLAQEVRY